MVDWAVLDASSSETSHLASQYIIYGYKHIGIYRSVRGDHPMI